jgi:hypothetical protein
MQIGKKDFNPASGTRNNHFEEQFEESETYLE